MEHPSALTDEDRSVYAWQLDLPGFGEAGQARLRAATALVSRIGGLGGPIALQLAAAGIGRLILAHGGNLEPADLNRQILMRHAGLGRPRVESARETLRAFNPHIAVEVHDSHICHENAAALVGQADIVFDAAPRFGERFLLNRECVHQGKPLIDAAVYGMEGQLLCIVPGETPCLACLYPEEPAHWRRRFPVLCAVSSLFASLAVLEGVKLLTGLAPALRNTLFYLDTRALDLRRISVQRRAGCSVCGHLPPPAAD